MKKSCCLPTWMDLESIMLGEISQKNKSHLYVESKSLTHRAE